MRLRSIDDAMSALYVYVPNTASLKANYTLDRIRQFLAQIGNPQDQYPAIHIAGTSGKTSTAYFVRALLQQAGQPTGLTVSPHIVSVTERVQLDGQPLPDGEFLHYLERFLPMVEGSGIHLTYFEVLMAFAYWIFAERDVKYVVVETGLGGLLDGSNVISRTDKVCAITDLGLDHTEVLGETLEEIAFQKAGIIQPGNHVFLIDQDPRAVGVVVAEANARQATLHMVTPSTPTDGVTPIFQQRNVAMAAAVYDYLATRDALPCATETMVQTVVSAPPPGRMKRYDLAGKLLILDGAHNPQKLAALRQALEASGVKSTAVLASLLKGPSSKLDSSLLELRPLAAHLIVPEFSVVQDIGKESPPAEELASRASRLGYASVQVCPRLNDAVEVLLQRPERVLLVTGSLYLVSQVRALVKGLAIQ